MLFVGSALHSNKDQKSIAISTYKVVVVEDAYGGHHDIIGERGVGGGGGRRGRHWLHGAVGHDAAWALQPNGGRK